MDDLDSARPAANLVGAHTRQSLCEHVPVGRCELHRVTGRKRAVATHDADSQEAPPVNDQRALSALVDDEPPDRGLGVAEPELERAAAVRGLCRKARAATFPGNDRAENLAAPAGSDDRWNARSGCESRSGDLAGHPPATQRASLAQHRLCGGASVNEQLRTARFRGMRCIDPIHLGQQDEKSRVRQDCDLRRERIVVSERDLVSRRRVVLVHDGNNAELQ